MKRVLFLTLLLTLSVLLGAQYPLTQNLASDSSIVRIGATYNGAIKGGLINMAFTDTTAANLSRISFYAGAQIFTTSDTAIWVRNKTATNTYWARIGGTGGGASGTFWNIYGTNAFPAIPANYGIGTSDATALPFKTNNTQQMILPATGLVRSSGAANKFVTFDTTTKLLYYGDGGSSTLPISSLTAATGTNSINNGDLRQTWNWNTLSGVNGIRLESTSTAATSNEQTLLYINTTGVNTNAAETTYGAQIFNSHSGSLSGNIGLNINVSGGTASNVGAQIISSGVGLQLGVAGSSKGIMTFCGNTSGTITLQPAAAAGTYTLTLPTTDGNASEFLQTDGSGVLVFAEAATATNTITLTNKRWVPRVGSTTSSATPTINTDNVDIYKLTAQAADITSFTTNLSGTPNDGDLLEIQITGTAARAITWGASFVSTTVTLPTTTVTTTTLTIILQYCTTSSYGNNKWHCVNYY